MDDGKLVRVISDRVDLVEDQVNALLEKYAALMWHFDVIGGELRLSVVLLNKSVLERAQLQAALLRSRNVGGVS